MCPSPFIPCFEELPETLPIFPLENAVVLPGAGLPLNIFEPRYLDMVSDALATHHMFGMVQPDPAGLGTPVPVYNTGCAGRITAYQETGDGRILLSLTGVCRFDIQEELATTRAYRMVVPDWSRYAQDLNPDESEILHDRLRWMGTLRRYFRSQNLDTDWDSLQQMPGLELVHTLAVSLPLASIEKQAILEAQEPSGRADALLAALEFSLQESSRTPPH